MKEENLSLEVIDIILKNDVKTWQYYIVQGLDINQICTIYPNSGSCKKLCEAILTEYVRAEVVGIREGFTKASQKFNFRYPLLTIATILRQTKVLELLLKNKAKVDLTSGQAVSYMLGSNTALIEAARLGHVEEVKLLLKYGAKVNVLSKDGVSGLMLASVNDKQAVVKILLEAGANANKTDQFDKTALMKASSEGHVGVVKILLKHGAKVNKADKYGWTALIAASIGGHLEVVEALLTAKVRINKPYKGVTALMIASQQGYTEIAKLLLSKKAKVNKTSKFGQTPLMSASKHCHEEIVKILIKAGAKVNKVDNLGKSALILASEGGSIKIVELLLQAGAQVNKGDKRDKTALMEASWLGNVEIVKLLLKAGADINKVNKYDNSALKLASNGNRAEISKLLLIHQHRLEREIKECVELNYKEIKQSFATVGATTYLERLDKWISNVMKLRAEKVEKGMQVKPMLLSIIALGKALELNLKVLVEVLEQDLMFGPISYTIRISYEADMMIKAMLYDQRSKTTPGIKKLGFMQQAHLIVQQILESVIVKDISMYESDMESSLVDKAIITTEGEVKNVADAKSELLPADKAEQEVASLFGQLSSPGFAEDMII